MFQNDLQQFISTAELKHNGFSNYQINQMVSRGILLKVNNRYYQNLNYKGEINDFYAVHAVNEHGIVCLVSAAIYHGLSTERQRVIEVALPRGFRKPGQPEWPLMQFYFFSPERYQLGIQYVQEGKNSFQIYDKEKTVCDMVFYRNKLGKEPAMETVKEYMNCQDRDINKLMYYADILHVKTTLMQYIEVLL